VYKFVRSFFVALTAVPMAAGLAFGSEHHGLRNSNSCEAGRPIEQHAWLPVGQSNLFGSTGRAAAQARKIENAHSALNGMADSQFTLDRPAPSAAPRNMAQDGKLALLENAPLPLNGNSKVASPRPDQTWVRLSDTPNIPEPGSWAVLLAGFLGICAVARPRIFTS